MGNKTPVKGTVSVDVHAHSSRPDGAPNLRPIGTPAIDPPVLPAMPMPDMPPVSRAPQTEVAQAWTAAVSIGDAVTPAVATSVPRTRTLKFYRIPSGIHLPDVDAQGFRVYQGRQFAEVMGGFVQVGIDPHTGLLRARLASESTPSGPVLVNNPDSRFWRALEESDATIYRSATEEGSEARQPEARDMESGDSEDVFHMASESMPIAPYTSLELAHMRQPPSFNFRDNRPGSYNRANNGRYPLRDTRGRPIRIRKIDSRVTSVSENSYLAADIKPYIRFEGFDEVGRLYEEKLEVRRFTSADAKVPQEHTLIGQMMVAANRRIAKGEAIGVYGGTVMPLKYVPRSEQTFTMYVGQTFQYGPGHLIPERLVVVGDNAISRINSNFEYNEVGKPVRQSRTGFNVEPVAFNIHAELLIGDSPVTKPYVLTAVFATEDIPAGTELRMDYDYTDQEMSWVFGR